MNVRHFLLATVASFLFSQAQTLAQVLDLPTRLAQIRPATANAHVATYNGRNVQLKTTINSSDGKMDYFTITYPSAEIKRWPVLVMVAPYIVIPQDAAWVAELRQAPPLRSIPSLRIDSSFPREARAIECLGRGGDCYINLQGPANYSNLAAEGDVFEGPNVVDAALASGCAVVVSYVRFYQGRSFAANVHTVANAIEALTLDPQIDQDRIALLGRSWGGTMALLAVTISNRPLPIRAVVAEAAAIDGPWIIGYYLNELKVKQPTDLYLLSLEFSKPYYNRLHRSLGPLDSADWNYFTINSIAARWPRQTALLLICSSNDLMVPCQQSVDLDNALGNRSDLLKFEFGLPQFATESALQGSHGTLPASRGNQILSWLADHLR